MRTAQATLENLFGSPLRNLRTIIGVLGVMGAIVPVVPAQAHSWYDSRCCSGRDCHPVPCAKLRAEHDGSVVFLPTGVRVFRENVLPSRDAQCHLCTSHPETDTGYGYCAYVLQGS